VTDGIRTVVATPHQLGRYRDSVTRERVLAGIATLQSELASQSIPLGILPGADVRVDERLWDMLASGDVFTIADTRRYLLLEMPHEVFVDAGRLVEKLAQHHVQVVLTHPERYRWIRRHIARMLEWRKQFGALLQVTAGSFTGEFGPEVQSLTWQMAERGMIDVVASDAHSADGHRRPQMSAARGLVIERLGQTTAVEWFESTPATLIAHQGN
jgi:protein-tyrosine phosphatase